MSQLLTFDAVSKRFANDVLALDRVSFSVAGGEFVSLVGPSGCGKSTILRLAAGLTPPTGGNIRWEGVRPRLGFVFQDAALMPWADVEKNVRLPLELLRMPSDVVQRRVKETLELVGLTAFAKAFPRELSGGMRMRVSIARALAVEPSVLLMDEPFAALDEFTRERLNDELRNLWRTRGLTILFVTHSIYESVYLSSRVLVMRPRPGRIVNDLEMSRPVERSAEFRHSGEYAERCRALRDALFEGAQA
ncbi:MAG: ATP-binding cassette domain-containing protein [Alphaproteobacteria bacterium]|nr:ATP-binding cassette domain-containing protein [Alphaproteobacteria bacterium]